MGLAGAFWFYYKLGWTAFDPVFWRDCFGNYFHPVFCFCDDGDFYRRSDRWSGRTFRRNIRCHFRRYGGIAYFQNQIDLALFAG